MAKIYAVNPRKDRHVKNAKAVLKEACNIVEGLNCEVAGYSIVAWDDTGRAAWSFENGAHVGFYQVPDFVRDVLNTATLKNKLQ